MDFHEEIEIREGVLTLFQTGSKEFQFGFSEVVLVFLNPLFKLLTDGHSEGVGAGLGERTVGNTVGKMLIQRKLDISRAFNNSWTKVFVAGSDNKVFSGEGLLESMTLGSEQVVSGPAASKERPEGNRKVLETAGKNGMHWNGRGPVRMDIHSKVDIFRV